MASCGRFDFSCEEESATAWVVGDRRMIDANKEFKGGRPNMLWGMAKYRWKWMATLIAGMKNLFPSNDYSIEPVN